MGYNIQEPFAVLINIIVITKIMLRNLPLLTVFAIAALLAASTVSFVDDRPAYAVFASPLQQLKEGIGPDEIRCNADRVLALRDSGAHVCVRESTAHKMGWIITLTEPAKAVGNPANAGEGFVTVRASSEIPFADDGREIQRSVLQRAPAPAPWYETIMDAHITPDNIGPDSLIRVPAMPHEKYSVNPGVGMYVEDWMPTYIIDGQKLLYATNECYPSGDCRLDIYFVPSDFTLTEDVTNYELGAAKGFKVHVGYHTVPLDESEDADEAFWEARTSQSGNYGGFREMTRDGNYVSAYQGGNDYNHYHANIAYTLDDHTIFSVNSNYHTIDELMPVFDSIGN